MNTIELTSIYRGPLLVGVLLTVGILGCSVDHTAVPQARPVVGASTEKDKPKTASSAAKPMTFLTNYRQGIELARSESKPALVFFTLPNCANSKKMMESTFSDEEIVRLSSRFVCILVDGSESPELCEASQIKGFPTILFLSPQGAELQRLAGKQSPDQLALQMHVAIQSTAAKTAAAVR